MSAANSTPFKSLPSTSAEIVRDIWLVTFRKGLIRPEVAMGGAAGASLFSGFGP